MTNIPSTLPIPPGYSILPPNTLLEPGDLIYISHRDGFRDYASYGYTSSADNTCFIRPTEKREEEHITLLREAFHEIKALRRQNELLRVKVDTFDSLMCLFQTQPAFHGQPMSPDLCYEIEKHLKKNDEH